MRFIHHHASMLAYGCYPHRRWVRAIIFFMALTVVRNYPDLDSPPQNILLLSVAETANGTPGIAPKLRSMIVFIIACANVFPYLRIKHFRICCSESRT